MYASGWNISTFMPKLVWNKLSEFGIISFGRIFQTMNFGTASPQYSKLILVTHLKNPDVSSVKTIGVCISRRELDDREGRLIF